MKAIHQILLINFKTMKKSISISVILIFLSVAVFGQQNKISISAGYSINLTNHWFIYKWEKPISIDLRFNHTKGLLLIGCGINYSKYDISRFRYYESDKNSISNLSPYIQIGLNLEKNRIALIPYLNLGYSALITDIEIYNGRKGGFYSAVGLDCNFKISEKFQLGLGANYGMIFNKLNFIYPELITCDFVPIEDKIMKSFTMNLNFVYKL